jgi:hypothetical protein
MASFAEPGIRLQVVMNFMGFVLDLKNFFAAGGDPETAARRL